MPKINRCLHGGSTLWARVHARPRSMTGHPAAPVHTVGHSLSVRAELRLLHVGDTIQHLTYRFKVWLKRLNIKIDKHHVHAVHLNKHWNKSPHMTLFLWLKCFIIIKSQRVHHLEGGNWWWFKKLSLSTNVVHLTEHLALSTSPAHSWEKL